jgi:hypothetical protein
MVNRPLTNDWAHSSAWIEWLPAEQLVEGSSPSGPELTFHSDELPSHMLPKSFFEFV